MAFFKHFKIKLLISVVIAGISSLYQLETPDDLHITEKQVMLSKSRPKSYEFLLKLEEYPTVC